MCFQLFLASIGSLWSANASNWIAVNVYGSKSANGSRAILLSNEFLEIKFMDRFLTSLDEKLIELMKFAWRFFKNHFWNYLEKLFNLKLKTESLKGLKSLEDCLKLWSLFYGFLGTISESHS